MIGLTGGRGVLGSLIAAHLRRAGHEVDLFPGDIREAAAVEAWVGGLETVVHAAAMVPVHQVEANPGEAVAVNVGGTASIAKAAAAAGCRLVYISSSHVYRSSDRPLAETDPVHPVSLYGMTKWQGEQWVERLTSGSAILRVFSFFDPRQPTSYLVPSLRARILDAPANARLDLFGSANVRDIADADWMAARIADLAALPAAGVVNVGTGRARTVRDIAEAVARALGRSDVQWNALQDGPPNMLLADTRSLAAQAERLPSFDLERAVAAWSSAREA